jgi:hypothetical protein
MFLGARSSTLCPPARHGLGGRASASTRPSAAQVPASRAPTRHGAVPTSASATPACRARAAGASRADLGVMALNPARPSSSGASRQRPEPGRRAARHAPVAARAGRRVVLVLTSAPRKPAPRGSRRGFAV